VQAAGREAGRADRRVLLGDADVPDPAREAGRERAEADGVQHRGGDRDDVVPLLADAEHLLAEHRRPGGPARGGQRLAGAGVHRADGVEVVLLVREGGLVAAALLGEAVHEDGAVETFRAAQRGLDGLDVVAVDGADVLQA